MTNEEKQFYKDYVKKAGVDNDYSYYLVGEAYLKLKDYNSAIKYFDEAIRLGTTNPWYFHNRGLAHYGLENYENAKVDFDAAISLSEIVDHHHYYNRARVYNKLGKNDLAIIDLEKALESYPLNYYANDLLKSIINDHNLS